MICSNYRLGSRLWLNETSQISEPNSDQMPAVVREKSWPILGRIYLSMIEYPKYDWHAAFSHKRLCYSRTTAGTFILNLLFSAAEENTVLNSMFLFISFKNKTYCRKLGNSYLETCLNRLVIHRKCLNFLKKRCLTHNSIQLCRVIH